MESGIRSAALLTAMFLATALYMAGCATPGNEQTKLPVTLQRAQQDYDQAIMRTEETEDTLNELTLAAEIDLKQAYDTFSRSADRMREAGKILVAHADAMHYRGAYYFVESGKSATACVYPRSGEPEDKGATELDSYFNAISEEGWEVKRAWRAFQFDINQIQEYLFKYPTPKGIEAITFMIRKAKVDSDLLQASLEQALAALERAKTAKAQADLNGESAIMPPGSTPPPAPNGITPNQTDAPRSDVLPPGSTTPPAPNGITPNQTDAPRSDVLPPGSTTPPAPNGITPNQTDAPR